MPSVDDDDDDENDNNNSFDFRWEKKWKWTKISLRTPNKGEKKNQSALWFPFTNRVSFNSVHWQILIHNLWSSNFKYNYYTKFVTYFSVSINFFGLAWMYIWFRMNFPFMWSRFPRSRFIYVSRKCECTHTITNWKNLPLSLSVCSSCTQMCNIPCCFVRCVTQYPYTRNVFVPLHSSAQDNDFLSLFVILFFAQGRNERNSRTYSFYTCVLRISLAVQ